MTMTDEMKADVLVKASLSSGGGHLILSTLRTSIQLYPLMGPPHQNSLLSVFPMAAGMPALTEEGAVRLAFFMRKIISDPEMIGEMRAAMERAISILSERFPGAAWDNQILAMEVMET